MAITYTLTVDNVGVGAQIIVQSFCRFVRLRQNDQSVATLQPYLVRVPFTTSTPVRKEGGEAYELPAAREYSIGQVLGYIQLVNAASVSFAQEET